MQLISCWVSQVPRGPILTKLYCQFWHTNKWLYSISIFLSSWCVIRHTCSFHDQQFHYFQIKLLRCSPKVVLLQKLFFLQIDNRTFFVARTQLQIMKIPGITPLLSPMTCVNRFVWNTAQIKLSFNVNRVTWWILGIFMPGVHESSDMALITSGKTISFTVHVIKI